MIGDINDWSRKDVDLVIMNPPWGAQLPMADRPFLEAAFNSEANVVYLLHSAHITHVLPLAKSFKWDGEIVLNGSFRLPANYAHNQSRDGVTEVPVWRFIRN